MAFANSAAYTITVIGEPTLTTPGHGTPRSDSASLHVTTDQSGGTLYRTAGTNNLLKPTAVQVKAGETSTGATAFDVGSSTVAGAGLQGPFQTVGYVAATEVGYWFVHEDPAGNLSNVEGGTFTTAAANLFGSSEAYYIAGVTDPIDDDYATNTARMFEVENQKRELIVPERDRVFVPEKE